MLCRRTASLRSLYVSPTNILRALGASSTCLKQHATGSGGERGDVSQSEFAKQLSERLRDRRDRRRGQFCCNQPSSLGVGLK